jgi:hypothetical protein
MVVEGPQPPASGIPKIQEVRAERKRRRVSDDIFRAFYFACDIRNLEAAERLLSVLENLLIQRVDSSPASRKRELDPLAAARKHLSSLREPEPPV